MGRGRSKAKQTKVARDLKYRKGWKEYYNLSEFLKNIPRLETKKKKQEPVSDSDSDDSK